MIKAILDSNTAISVFVFGDVSKKLLISIIERELKI